MSMNAQRRDHLTDCKSQHKKSHGFPSFIISQILKNCVLYRLLSRSLTLKVLFPGSLSSMWGEKTGKKHDKSKEGKHKKKTTDQDQRERDRKRQGLLPVGETSGT